MSDVFRFAEDDCCGFGCSGHLDPVTEYCSESYPEGYKILNAVLCDKVFLINNPEEPEFRPDLYQGFKWRAFEPLPERETRLKVLDMLEYLKSKLVVDKASFEAAKHHDRFEKIYGWYWSHLLDEIEEAIDSLSELR